MVILFLVASQVSTEQNCLIHLNANTTDSTYQYTTEPISVTVMAKQTDTCTEKCIWSVNGHQQDDIDGSSNPCTFTLKLTTNVTSVKCILGNPIKAVYSISFENIHHSK